MKIIVVGLGVQGKKRLAIANEACVATVDPFDDSAQYKSVEDVPLQSYDAALVCVPDDAKMSILHYLLENGKHLLVEKPLLSDSNEALMELFHLASRKNLICYTAYNHRFEPHIMRMKQLLDTEALGTLYKCRLFYGNGTARIVRSSPWRDTKAGVITDLGSHLLDMVHYFFGEDQYNFTLSRSFTFENNSPDHAYIHSTTSLPIDLELSLLSYRNEFTCDIIGEKGSAHIHSLCKWGPSSFIWRKRQFPSGRPDEEAITIVQSDPTWEREYKYFLQLIQGTTTHISSDLWIHSTIHSIAHELFMETKG